VRTLTFPTTSGNARTVRSLMALAADRAARCIAGMARSLSGLIADHAKAQWASGEPALHLRHHRRIRAAYVAAKAVGAEQACDDHAAGVPKAIDVVNANGPDVPIVSR